MLRRRAKLEKERAEKEQRAAIAAARKKAAADAAAAAAGGTTTLPGPLGATAASERAFASYAKSPRSGLGLSLMR
jgi:hypothetical protein